MFHRISVFDLEQPRKLLVLSTGEIAIAYFGTHAIAIFQNIYDRNPILFKDRLIKNPRGICEYLSKVYVACYETNGVAVIDISALKRGFVKKMDEIQFIDGFQHPRGLCVIQDELIVTDVYNHRIVGFSVDNIEKPKWNVNGFKFPRGIDGVDDKIVVVDSGANQLVVLNKQRKWTNTILGFSAPNDVVSSIKENTVWISEWFEKNIKEVDIPNQVILRSINLPSIIPSYKIGYLSMMGRIGENISVSDDDFHCIYILRMYY